MFTNSSLVSFNDNSTGSGDLTSLSENSTSLWSLVAIIATLFIFIGFISWAYWYFTKYRSHQHRHWYHGSEQPLSEFVPRIQDAVSSPVLPQAINTNLDGILLRNLTNTCSFILFYWVSIGIFLTSYYQSFIQNSFSNNLSSSFTSSSTSRYNSTYLR